MNFTKATGTGIIFDSVSDGGGFTTSLDLSTAEGKEGGSLRTAGSLNPEKDGQGRVTLKGRATYFASAGETYVGTVQAINVGEPRGLE